MFSKVANALAAAAARLGDYDRIVVTSPNGARRLLDVAGNLPVTDWPPVAAIGPATAAPLRAAGALVDLVPEEAVADVVYFFDATFLN